MKGGVLVGTSVCIQALPGLKESQARRPPTASLASHALHVQCIPQQQWKTLEFSRKQFSGLLMFNLTMARVWNPEAKEGRVGFSLLS